LETIVLCPFRVGTLLWEAQPGQRSLTVLVKATFLLVNDGEAVPAPDQDPIADDIHWEESALGSLRRPADLAPLKRRVDLSLVGHAYAPGGEPVESLTARLRVGDFIKTLEIQGDRLWISGAAGLTVGAPIPFVQMPIRYERAPLSPDNPVGVDVDAKPSLGAPARANIDRVDGPRAQISAPARGSVPPGRAAAAPPPPVPAVGFGPITPTWRPRRKLLDDAGLFWAYGVAAEGGSAGPAPAGFNFEFFNAAPRDQQIDMLRAGAVIELDNLSRKHPRLTTALPAIRPQVFRIDPRTGRSEEIILRCDTLWIDADRGVATLTFRGLHDVGPGGEEAIGTLLVAADPQGKKLRGDRVEQMARAQSPGTLGPARASTTTAEADPLGLRYDAVKSPRSGPAAAPQPAITAAAPAAAKHEPTQRFDWQTGFASDEPTSDLPRNEEVIRDHTRDISQLPRRAPLPFQGHAAPAAPREIAALASAPTLLAPTEIRIDTLPPPPMVAAATNFVAPIPALPPPPMVAAATNFVAPDLDAPTTTRGIAPPAAVPAPIAIAVPAAPLADVGLKTLPFGLKDLAGAPPAAKPVVAAPRAGSTLPQKTTPMEPDPAPETVPIERYAGISAALSRKGVDRGSVLRAQKLTIAGWGAIDRHWKRALAEQTDRGEKTLLQAFDVAYVSAQGELHRPVGVREYARILIGLERGEVGRVLAALELQLSDLMRLQRVWSKRVADGADLAAELAVALEEARKA
jgi:hypothetical protein